MDAPFNLIGFRFHRYARALAGSFDFRCCGFAAEMVDLDTVDVFAADGAINDATDLLDGPQKEQPLPEFNGRSPRQMMQTLGTEWGRDLVDGQLWITVARKHLERLAALPKPVRPTVVFSDVRFENEAAMIREIGELSSTSRGRTPKR